MMIASYKSSNVFFAALYSVGIFILISISACNPEDDDKAEEELIIEPQDKDTDDGIVPNPNNNDFQGENLLVNGGLEEWNSFFFPVMPKGWSLPSNEYVNRSNSFVYEGMCSAKMRVEKKGNTARLEQEINVSSMDKIRIRFHYYIEQWKTNGARTYCYFRTRAAESSNISSIDLESFYGKDIYYILRGGGYGLTYFPYKLNEWQTFDESIEIPPTATYFVFGINSYYGTTLYIDDCYVLDVSERTPIKIEEVNITY